ncbi:MAG: extracellular solute-binding protein [Spirochaetaceae bacterium]|nr:extracellular solute-binding protein [Spirochaetaceae bacterium]
MKKPVFFYCLLVLVLLSFIACGQKEPQQQEKKELQTIRFAYSWDHDFVNDIIEYNEKIKDKYNLVTEESIGLTHKQKIFIDASSNTLPDVFLFWSYETNLKYLAERGYLQDVQEYFDASNSVQKSDFYEENLKATEVSGINYAVPHERFFGYLAANKSLFDKYNLDLPRVWDDFKTISPVLLENGIIPLAMGSFRGDPGHLFYSALAYQDPEGFTDTINMKNNNNFIYPGTVQATEAVLDLITYNAIPKNTIQGGSFEEQIASYNDKKSAMTFSFSWSLALFDESVIEDTVIIPVPQISSGGRDSSTFTVGGTAQSICINKKSWNDLSKRESIIDLVDWLLSDDIYITRFIKSGNIPAKKVSLPEDMNVFYTKALEYVTTVDILGIHEFYFNSLNSYNIYKEANDLLWSGALSRDEFLNMVQKGIDHNDQ